MNGPLYSDGGGLALVSKTRLGNAAIPPGRVRRERAWHDQQRFYQLIDQAKVDRVLGEAATPSQPGLTSDERVAIGGCKPR